MPLTNENTRGVTGLCLSAVDIAISKLAAGREKDMRYVTALVSSLFRRRFRGAGFMDFDTVDIFTSRFEFLGD